MALNKKVSACGYSDLRSSIVKIYKQKAIRLRHAGAIQEGESCHCTPEKHADAPLVSPVWGPGEMQDADAF